LAEALDEFEELRAGLMNDENVTALEFLRMRGVRDELVLVRGSPGAAEALVVETRVPNVGGGNKNDWRPSTNQPKDALKRIRVALEEAQSAIRQRATARLVQWLESFVTSYAARRKADGVADFDDLLIWARDLVREEASVRAYFRGKYHCFLVDEFQDTDPVQVEMIVRLCGEDDPADWRATRLRPGSLFVVGDPKQSIYRFRRADISMYDGVKRGIFRGNVEQITQNFRSGGAIIDWVNGVFEQLISETPGMQPAYVALDAHQAFPPGSVILVHAAAPANTAASLRQAEATAIAALVLDAVAAGSWQVRSPDGSRRPATFADIAILIPSRTELRLYEDALARAHVPYLHEGGRTFFQRQEVRDLTTILRAIDDPSDQAAIVAALRSEAFACSDEDLIVYRDASRFDYMRVRDDASGPVADGLRKLRSLANQRHEKPLVALVRSAIDELRLIEAAMLHHQGEQGAANILKVLDQARAYAEVRPSAGLRGFARWLRTNLERDADETDASISEDSDDVLRILTIHASKGLEFPIVVFANMNTERVDRTNAIVSRQDSAPSFEMKIGAKEAGFRTPGYEHAETPERGHAAAEQLRLLYVAATRARDHLIVPFVAADGVDPLRLVRGDPKSLNDCLRLAGGLALQGGLEASVTVIDASSLAPLGGEPPPIRESSNGHAAGDATSILNARDEWSAERERLIARADSGLRVVTASSLKPEWEAIASRQEVRRGAAVEFGIAVHAALERAPLDGSSRIDELCAAVAREYGFTDRTEELALCVQNAIGSPIVARAARSSRLLREVPFTVAAAGGGLAEGRIDLLFSEDGGIVVVDFKSDAVSRGEASTRTRHYREQGLVYAWAAHEATGLPIRQVVFLYVRLPHEETIAVDAAFMREAEALIRGAGAA
jgi:ATP-dependent helicase/nuclease subunit A